MATINLLTSSFNGKLGAHYGVSQYNKKYVKAVPFSHTPHNKLQSKSVRAFEILNRISAQIARAYFDYLPLSAKDMSKMNCVAHLLKPLVSEHLFDATQLSVVFGDKETFYVKKAEMNEEQTSFLVTVENLADERTFQDSAYYIGIFDYYGYLKGDLVFEGNSFSAYIPCIKQTTTENNILIMRVVKRSGKKILFGSWSLGAVLKLISNSILWTSRFTYANDFELSGEVLTATQRTFENISDEIITLGE